MSDSDDKSRACVEAICSGKGCGGCSRVERLLIEGGVYVLGGIRRLALLFDVVVWPR